jgi:uncharacterized membrane protein
MNTLTLSSVITVFLAAMTSMPASAGLYNYSEIKYPGTPVSVSSHSVTSNGLLAVNLWTEGADAYLWTKHGPARTLLPVPGFQSQVLDVNAAGIAVGESSSLYGERYSRATVWRDEQAIFLPSLGGTFEAATAINSAGLIVGTSYTRTTPSHGITRAVIWDKDGVHDLGTGGGVTAGAWGLNSSGLVVGTTRFEDGHEEGSLWNDGAVSHVGTLGGSRSVLSDVNDHGWAIGDSLLAGDNEAWRAVLWNGSSLLDLGTLGGNWSSAYDIAEDGTVFGSAAVLDGQEHATMWQAGRAIDLHDLVSNVADLGRLTLNTAIGVDAEGNIYGYLYDRKTYSMGTFVLSPIGDAEVSEPGSIALLLAGLGTLLACTRRKG